MEQLKSGFAGHEPVNFDGKSLHEEYRCHIAFWPEDTKAFKKLTEQNMGKQVLIQFGDQPVVARRITGPITEGRLSITIPDEKSLDEMRENLAPLLREQ